jgi:integrase
MGTVVARRAESASRPMPVRRPNAGCARAVLANDGVDTRALQHYLGHRNIQHTVRYTELRSDRFNGFWKD